MSNIDTSATNVVYFRAQNIHYYSMQYLILALPYIQIALSVILVILILVQQRGSGAGGAFGGGGSITYQKRGIEKSLSQATVIIAIIFAGIALARILM